MKQRFYSKVDAWIIIALAAPLIALVLFFTVPEDSFNDVWSIILPTIIVAFCYLIIFLCLPCYYEMDGKYLRIRSGIIVKRDLLIPEIREVKDSHDPITAPAMSLKRICITTKGGSEALISPKNKEEFIASLLRINPNIKCSK